MSTLMKTKNKSRSIKLKTTSIEEETRRRIEEYKKYLARAAEAEENERNMVEETVSHQSKNELFANDVKEETDLSRIVYVRPGRKIFLESNLYQIFDLGHLAENLDYEISFDLLRNMLSERLLIIPDANSSLCETLFFLMSIDKEYFVSDSCLRILSKNINIWVPTMNHILLVLMNWGATLDTLRLTNYEVELIVGAKDPVVLKQNTGDQIGIEEFNRINVLSYLVIVLKNKTYRLEETVILTKILSKITLELYCVLAKIKIVISVAVNSLEHWDNFKVMTFSRYLYDNSEHFHDQIFMATAVIPNYSKCREISSCLCFAIMRAIITSTVSFSHPCEDEEFVQLVTEMTKVEIMKDDLYKCHGLIELINFLVCQRALEYTNPGALNSLKDTLDSFALELTRSNKTMEAAVVRGRILCCTAIWGLFKKECFATD